MSTDVPSPSLPSDAPDLVDKSDSIQDEQTKHRDELIGLLAEGKEARFRELFNQHIEHLEAAMPDVKQVIKVTMDILEDILRGLKGLQSCTELEHDVLDLFLTDAYRTLQKIHKILRQSFGCKHLKYAMAEFDANDSNQERAKLEYLLSEVQDLKELFYSEEQAYSNGCKTIGNIFFNLANVFNGNVNPELYASITDKAKNIEESNTVQLQWMCEELLYGIAFYGQKRHIEHPQLAIVDLIKASPREKVIGMHMIADPEIFALLVQASTGQKLIPQITPQIKQLLIASKLDILEGVTWLEKK